MPDKDIENEALSAAGTKSDLVSKIPIYLIWFYGLFLLSFGLIISAPSRWLSGLGEIFSSSSLLLTDYMKLAGPGLAFVNAGLITLFYFLLIRLSKAPINGNSFAAIFMLSGFAFFGKNLFNAIPIFWGVLLHALVVKKEFKEFVNLALFGSCLGPLVSSVAFHFALPLGQGIVFAYLLGIFIGFVLPVLSAVFVKFHQGYSLYNMGFAAGFLAMLITSFLILFGFSFEHQNIIYDQPDMRIDIWLLLLLLFLFAAGIISSYLEIKNRSKKKDAKALFSHLLRQYRDLLGRSGRLATDFIEIYGPGVNLINMALTGLVGYLYLLISGGRFNGPILGALLSMIGFASFGKHPGNTFPILTGVIFTNLISGTDLASTNAVISGLLGTALAPMAGSFGILPGIITGMAHMSIVSLVKNLHAGTNLYNNGFSAGLIVMLLYPLFEILKREKMLPRQWLQKIISRFSSKD